ncbi:hypothetical protein SADUNF_Sadunf17G0058300 [Salix dunnii]|uniref:Uncharacterized protein n=1 Tax=Salix dunnii TaxID=1413687 RepID=A0A835J2S2_9ROSI|nr:hypothetical protein SADUNF_Sadunf17G0058300 [Salix dunnii]
MREISSRINQRATKLDPILGNEKIHCINGYSIWHVFITLLLIKIGILNHNRFSFKFNCEVLKVGENDILMMKR